MQYEFHTQLVASGITPSTAENSGTRYPSDLLGVCDHVVSSRPGADVMVGARLREQASWCSALAVTSHQAAVGAPAGRFGVTIWGRWWLKITTA
jgi:hypothetical protein